MSGIDISQQLSNHKDDLAKVAQAAVTGSEESFIRATAALLGKALTGLPVVGVLAEEAAARAFALSAYGRMQKAMAELDAELTEEAKLQRVVEELEARICVAGRMIAGAPVPAGWSDFARTFAEAAAQANVVIASARGEAGGIGLDVELSPGGESRMVAGEVVGLGKGSIGARIRL